MTNPNEWAVEVEKILSSPDSVKLVEYEISDNLWAQGIRPAVYPLLTKEATQQILSLIEAEVIKELEKLSLDIIEPCEPECSEVRHARHEGSWAAHVKVETRLEALKSKEANHE